MPKIRLLATFLEQASLLLSLLIPRMAAREKRGLQNSPREERKKMLPGSLFSQDVLRARGLLPLLLRVLLRFHQQEAASAFPIRPPLPAPRSQCPLPPRLSLEA